MRKCDKEYFSYANPNIEYRSNTSIPVYTIYAEGSKKKNVLSINDDCTMYIHNVLLLMLMLIHHSPYKYQLCLHDQTRWSEIVKIIRKIHGFCLHSFYYVATFIAFYLFFHSFWVRPSPSLSISMAHFVCWFFSLIFHLSLVLSLSAHILDFIDALKLVAVITFIQDSRHLLASSKKKKNGIMFNIHDKWYICRCVWEEVLKLIFKSFRFIIDWRHSTIIIKYFQQTYALLDPYPFVIWYLFSRFTSIRQK